MFRNGEKSFSRVISYPRNARTPKDRIIQETTQAVSFGARIFVLQISAYILGFLASESNYYIESYRKIITNELKFYTLV